MAFGTMGAVCRCLEGANLRRRGLAENPDTTSPEVSADPGADCRNQESDSRSDVDRIYTQSPMAAKWCASSSKSEPSSKSSLQTEEADGYRHAYSRGVALMTERVWYWSR